MDHEGLESVMGSGWSWDKWKLHWSRPHPSGCFGNLWGSKLCPGIPGVRQFCRLGLRISGRKGEGPTLLAGPEGLKNSPRVCPVPAEPPGSLDDFLISARSWSHPRPVVA